MVADQRILAGAPATLTWQPVGGDGEPADPGATVTVGATRFDGTEVIAPGTATTGTGSAVRSVALAGGVVTDTDLLTVTWTAGAVTATTSVEVAGGYYFTITDARATDESLANEPKFPTPLLVEMRQVVEEEFETICGVAFVPRFTVEDVRPSDGVAALSFAQLREVVSITQVTDGTSEAVTDLDLFDGVSGPGLRGPFDRCGYYRIAYRHGYDRPPADVKNAAIVRLLDRATTFRRGIPDRATSFSVTDGGTYRLDQAGPLRTGIPDVDATLARWHRRILVA